MELKITIKNVTIICISHERFLYLLRTHVPNMSTLEVVTGNIMLGISPIMLTLLLCAFSGESRVGLVTVMDP